MGHQAVVDGLPREASTASEMRSAERDRSHVAHELEKERERIKRDFLFFCRVPRVIGRGGLESFFLFPFLWVSPHMYMT